jgi:hypothetical protein
LPRGAATVQCVDYPTRWEYKIEPLETDEYRERGVLKESLDQIGEDGWEFAGTVTLETIEGAGPHEHLVLKRPVS